MAVFVTAACEMLSRKWGRREDLQHEKCLCRLVPCSRNGNKGMILKRPLKHRPFCLLNAQRIDLWHLATGEAYRLLTNFNGQTLAEAAHHTSCAAQKVMTHLQASLMSLRTQLALHSQVKHYLVNTLQHKGNNQLKRWHCCFLLHFKSAAS